MPGNRNSRGRLRSHGVDPQSRLLILAMAAMLLACVGLPWPADAQQEPREEPRIKYTDVMKDPDNIELNFRFARQQVADGNVKGAAATLERILLIQPDLAVVRVFYAAVLIRLDSLDEAEQQLDLVSASGDPRASEQVERYRDVIADRRQKTRISVSVAAGGQYDTNPSATPAGNSLLVSDIAVTSGDTDDDYARLG